jgi:hypothetical protein
MIQALLVVSSRIGLVLLLFANLELISKDLGFLRELILESVLVLLSITDRVHIEI